jgi:hypothetical protein
MKRCDCGCEVWKKDREPEKDRGAPATKEGKDTRQHKEEAELKARPR